MMKRNLFFKTILLFLFTLLAFNIKTYASNSDFTYELDSNNNATITSYIGSSNNITIPSTINGYPVKKIANHAFNENRNNNTNGKILTNVIISEGITTLGDYSFIGCTNLESITLPESLTSLGFQTFIGCTSLNKINIPSNIKSIGPDLFQETGFTEFVIPEHIKTIGTCAFRICTNLKGIKVYSNDVSYQGNKVFEYCSDDLIMYGYAGSTTQSYAQANGIQFELLSNDSNNSNNTENISMTSITLNKNTLSLSVGDTEKLTATILPDNTTNKFLSWTSSNPSVATISNQTITAKSVGTTTITVSNADGSQKATCIVTVINDESSEKPTDTPTNIPIASLTLNKTSLSLYIGDTKTLTATIFPSNATDKTLIWSSSNSNIVSVENGKIVAKKAGTATITVSTKDGTQKSTCKISVTKKSSNSTNSETQKDNTTANSKLPQTGLYSLIPIIIFTLLAIVFISYKKYNNLKKI